MREREIYEVHIMKETFIPVEIHSSAICSVVALENAVGIEHGNKFEDVFPAQHLGSWVSIA